MIKIVLLSGFLLCLGRRLGFDSEHLLGLNVSYDDDFDVAAFLEQEADLEGRRIEQETDLEGGRRRRKKSVHAPAPPPPRGPAILEGYGLIQNVKCGGSWIENWKSGGGSGYGKGSAGNFAGCKTKCDAHDECAGFYFSDAKQICSNWRKGVLSPQVTVGNHCYYKKTHYTPDVFLPQLESLPSGIKEGTVKDDVLHYAYPHQVELMGSANIDSGLSAMKAPSKGEMRGIVGDEWEMQIDLSDAEILGFLPDGEPSSEREGKFKYEVKTQIRSWIKDTDTQRHVTMKWQGWYWTGKMFQKVGMICLLAEKYFGANDDITQKCAGILEDAFKCLYEPANAGKFGRKASGVCQGKPSGHYYSKPWGGITSQYGYDSLKGCRGRDDFGNACFNDHHYHYGYLVVSGAILAKLKPKYRTDVGLKDFVSTLIRDTANPSAEDDYFTQFRHFDWFDMHSWSRGITPNEHGKDQESVSEELNLFWGIHLWGGITGDAKLQRLGTTMLALGVNTAKQYFFTLSDNKNHYEFEKFTNRHVPGIFFQTMVTYTTWFCRHACRIGIHAIQMMPLTPALPLVRTKEFCEQEDRDSLQDLKFDPDKSWESVHVTGSKAFLDPEAAYYKIQSLSSKQMDDGLTKTWAMYWSASRPGAKGRKSSPTLTAPEIKLGRELDASSSVLGLVNGGKQPDKVGFKPIDWHLLEPSHTEVKGPKATNKFWVNWVVDNRTVSKGTGVEFPIFPMPYLLKWGAWSRKEGVELPPMMEVSRSDPKFGYMAWGSRTEGVPSYSAPFVGEFALSAVEGAHGGGHIILKESLFGVLIQVRGPEGSTRAITFPVFSGMAYVSGRYTGGFTPVIASTKDRQLTSITKVKDGIFSAKNDADVEFRVYVLDAAANFASSFDFDGSGVGNQPLDGWVRIAQVLSPEDTKVLDAHAQAVVLGFDLDVKADGKISYSFRKALR